MGTIRWISLFSLLVTLPTIAATPPASCPHIAGSKKHQITDTGPYHLNPIHSYEDVLTAMIANPYDYSNLPTIPIINFNFQTGEYEVGNRSRDILRERHVILNEYRRKPIHPMGIPVSGSMTFFKSNKYSGVFRGGTFPILSRFSISQGNPSRFEPRSQMQISLNRTPSPQVRSVTMGILLFDPNVASDQVSPIVSLVLQNDLNGKVNENTGQADYFLDETVLNKPEFDPRGLLPPTGRIYQYGTLGGVFFGALQTPFELTEADAQGIEATTLGVDPLLRPPHGFANFGENDPSKIRPPVWMKFVPRASNPPLIKMDDFRQEIYESLIQNGPRTYDIYVSDTFNSLTKDKIWEHAGFFTVDNAYLPSAGSDMGMIVPHGDVTNINYATGDSIYEWIQVIGEQ